MRMIPALPGAIGLGLILACGPAAAQQAQLIEAIKAMRQQLDQQRVRLEALERQLGDMLGLKVKVANDGSRGTVTLHYASLDQLDMICQRLSGEAI